MGTRLEELELDEHVAERELEQAKHLVRGTVGEEREAAEDEVRIAEDNLLGIEQEIENYDADD